MWKFFDHMETMFSTDQRIRPSVVHDSAVQTPPAMTDADDSGPGSEKPIPGRTAPERHEQLMVAMAEATKSAERTADSTKLFQERLLGTFSKGFDSLMGLSSEPPGAAVATVATLSMTQVEERKVRLAENKEKMDAFSMFRTAKADGDFDTMDFICEMYPDFKRYMPRH